MIPKNATNQSNSEQGRISTIFQSTPCELFTAVYMPSGTMVCEVSINNDALTVDNVKTALNRDSEFTKLSKGDKEDAFEVVVNRFSKL